MVSVTVGWVGKLHVKRSSRLANSIHSWANKGPEMESTRAVEINGVRRMIISPPATTGIEGARFPRRRLCRGKPYGSLHTRHSVFSALTGAMKPGAGLIPPSFESRRHFRALEFTAESIDENKRSVQIFQDNDARPACGHSPVCIRLRQY